MGVKGTNSALLLVSILCLTPVHVQYSFLSSVINGKALVCAFNQEKAPNCENRLVVCSYNKSVESGIECKEDGCLPDWRLQI